MFPVLAQKSPSFKEPLFTFDLYDDKCKGGYRATTSAASTTSSGSRYDGPAHAEQSSPNLNRDTQTSTSGDGFSTVRRNSPGDAA